MTTIETLCWVIYLCLNVPVRDLNASYLQRCLRRAPAHHCACAQTCKDTFARVFVCRLVRTHLCGAAQLHRRWAH